MKKCILIKIFLISYLSINAQISSSNLDYENLVVEGGKLYRNEYLVFKRFWAPKKPIKISEKPLLSFQQEQLNDVDSYLNSFFSCNNLEWYKKIVVKKDFFIGYNKVWFEYRNTTDFKSNYKIYVISKLFFKDQKTDKDYCMVMCKYNIGKKVLRLIPLVLEKAEKSWLLSENNDYSILSAYMYFKPEVLQKIFHQELIPELFGKCYGVNGFILNRDFAFKTFLSTDSNMPYPNLMLSHKKNNENNLAINDTVAYCDFTYETLCSNDNCKLFKYNSIANTSALFSNQYLFENINFKYDSLPELALTSWLFNKDLQEKEDNSLGFIKIKSDAINYIQKAGSHNRIEWLYKVTFDYESFQYVIIYFSEWYGELTERSSYKEKFVANKSILLKKVDNKWKCVFDLEDSNPLRLQRGLDKLNFEGINFSFNSKETGNSETDILINNKGLRLFVVQPDKRIYINNFLLGDSVKRYVYDLPREYVNGLGIKGPMDYYQQNNLTYWMDRN